MKLQRIAAFSLNNKGGNPAGVLLDDEMPPDSDMLKIAKQVGYSETAFLKPVKDGWRIRYFAPEMEIPFCGHATIASGAVLGEHSGEGDYKLFLNDGDISISVTKVKSGNYSVTLKSPDTWTKPVAPQFLENVLNEFNWTVADLDTQFPPQFSFAGAKHLIIVLKHKEQLSSMSYGFERLKALMHSESLVTINLVWAESDQVFHSRNPFPPGGVYEDPATGAAAAALAGYLRDIDWKGSNPFTIFQGEDMGSASRLTVKFGSTAGEGIYVTGETRIIDHPRPSR